MSRAHGAPAGGLAPAVRARLLAGRETSSPSGWWAPFQGAQGTGSFVRRTWGPDRRAGHAPAARDRKSVV
jgi:hypothetical protein